MANQTITNTTRNYDDAAISGLLNGETIFLDNGNVIINSDVRWGQQAAVCGNFTISTTLGGSVLIDGRDVWWMPYDGGTGNVPALGTVGVNDVTGSIAGVGEFLGVFTALGVSPSTAGTAMPSTGFIKFRRVTTAFVDNEVMTFAGGATATVNSATGGQRGWIHFVGAELSAASIPRLGTFNTLGDWFELGTTNGLDNQTFQYPVTDACPAIQIETAPGSGVYEWFINGGSRWNSVTQYISIDERGKFFGMNNTTGVITIANRGTNNCGFKPVSGLRVRIPNIITSSSTNANWNANTINATLASRWDFTTTSAGAVDIRNTCGNWFLSFNSAYSVNVEDSCTLHQILISNVATSTNIDNVAVGLNIDTNFTSLLISNMFSGASIANSRFVSYSANVTGNTSTSLTDCLSFTFSNSSFEIFGSLTTGIRRVSTSSYSAFFTRVADCSLTNIYFMGGRLELSQCTNITITGTKYADVSITSTDATVPTSGIVATNSSRNITIDGFSNFQNISNVHPYTGLASATSSSFIYVKNIGTSASPYNMGTASASGVIFTSSVCTDIDLRRLYTFNNRTGALNLAGTVQRINIINVWGDGGDSQTQPSLSSFIQGGRWTNSVVGQTACYGTHWLDCFTSTTTGRIVLAMNEPLPETASQVQVLSGNPRFTSTGNIAMPTLGDQIEWTMPYFALGYTSLANAAPTITGTNTTNFTYQYQIDTGTGFGTLKTLTGANLSAETISPTTGFKLRFRVTTNTSNSSNALTFIRIDGNTNATDQQLQYPLPFDGQGTITGITPNSRIQIYNETTATELVNQIVTGTSFTYQYYNGVQITNGDTIRLRLTYVSGASARLPKELTTLAASNSFNFLANQTSDEVYNNNGIDGSTVTEFSADYPNVQIDANDVDGVTTVQRIYAWFVYTLYSEDGIRNFFGGLIAEDEVNYKIQETIVDLKIDNTNSSTPLMVIGGRLYRDDGSTVIAATSNSVQLDPDKAYAVFIGGSGSLLTPTEQAQLANSSNKANLIPALL
jgi:hypothetical protein